MIQLKNLGDPIEKINRIERLKIEIIKDSTKWKLSLIEKKKRLKLMN